MECIVKNNSVSGYYIHSENEIILCPKTWNEVNKRWLELYKYIKGYEAKNSHKPYTIISTEIRRRDMLVKYIKRMRNLYCIHPF